MSVPAGRAMDLGTPLICSISRTADPELEKDEVAGLIIFKCNGFELGAGLAIGQRREVQ